MCSTRFFSVPVWIAAFATILSAPVTLPASAAYISSGTYDESAVQSNAVDTSATSDGQNTLSLATFSARVATAFAANRGGVIDFDNGTLAGPNTIEATFGVDQTRTITITNASSSSVTQGSTTLSTPISDGSKLGKAGPAAPFSTWNDFLFDFDPNDRIGAVGGTILSNFAVIGSPVGNVFGRVRYTDGSFTPSVISFVSSGAGLGADDTFWGFQAPTGLFIDRFELTITNDVAAALDDLAFIVVPEPGGRILVFMASLTMAVALRGRKALVWRS